MIANVKNRFTRVMFATLVVCCFASMVGRADDTEVFTGNYVPGGEVGRVKVLIVFDESGSMATDVIGRPPYDPDTVYAGDHNVAELYWSRSGEPPGNNSDHWVVDSTNRCAASFDPLAMRGVYQDNAISWRERDRIGNNSWQWGWGRIRSSDRNHIHLECKTDANEGDTSNPGWATPGYPQKTNTNGQEYGAAVSSVPWNSAMYYSFFTANYMNWYHDSSLQTNLGKRLDIAKDAVNSLVDTNLSVDFGLAVFNFNEENKDGDDDGGRIVRRIIDDMTVADRLFLTDANTGLINSLTAGGNTPLCETTYEAYQYLSGGDVIYGNSGGQIPAADPAAQASDRYIAPASECAFYIILMTDGLPRNDQDANAAIKALPAPDITSCGSYLHDKNEGMRENCLPELAEYMANTDLDGDSSNGKQVGITYTIGFLTDQELLSDTAEKGKGQYYTADNATELADAFRKAITSILSKESTFTSPAIAVNTFTRTQSRNDVFFAMFKPTEFADWPGNIKKLKMLISNGIATLVDVANDPTQPAIDPGQGGIAASATTFWNESGTPDGADVLAGGVGAELMAMDPSFRNLHTNTGLNGALESFVPANITAAAYGWTNPGDLFDFYNVADQDELDATINWARGLSNDPNVARGWLLADILHSKPLVVNYGALGSATTDDPDLRIVVGTNGGFLHMFDNSDGVEDWAFFPKELGPILSQRKENALTSQRVYGIDSPAVIFTDDVGHDGTIDASDGDKAYLYFGLRRGGSYLYALDISDPDSPEFLWKIDRATTGFSELGQTWSVPVVTKIPGYFDSDGPKPVLIFGAGYDADNDEHTQVAAENSDDEGRGVYIVDAATGELVWSITPDTNSATNLQQDDLYHAVPGSVKPLDSNGDELTDRIYFSDVGGNVWRADLPGNTLPDSDQDTWHVVKLAAFNTSTAYDEDDPDSVVNDRRFFNTPDVVRTLKDNFAFDAVLIGSGDRTNPLGTDVDNYFYMVRDEQIDPYFTVQPSTTECQADPSLDDFRCQLPVTVSDLVDFTDLPVPDPNDLAELANASGWYLELEGSGEKSLSSSVTIDGSLYFTTYAPESSGSACELAEGFGLLYAVNLYDASPLRDVNNSASIDKLDRYQAIGTLIPDTPSVHFGGDGELRLLLPGQQPIDTGKLLHPPRGTYWFQQEY